MAKYEGVFACGHSENEYGEDECPACNSTEFEILE